MAATLRARRNIVATRTRVGKTEKSSGRLTCMAVSSTKMAQVMLAVIKRSTTKVGRGTTSTTTTATTDSGTAVVIRRRHRARSTTAHAERGRVSHVPLLLSERWTLSCTEGPPGTAARDVPSLVVARPSWPRGSTSRSGAEFRPVSVRRAPSGARSAGPWPSARASRRRPGGGPPRCRGWRARRRRCRRRHAGFGPTRGSRRRARRAAAARSRMRAAIMSTPLATTRGARSLARS